MTIAETRIRTLCDEPVAEDGGFVLYWMQQSQRAAENPALEHAVRLANDLDLPVLVLFALDESYPDANERSFAFLLEGLAETASELADRGIKLVMRRGAPDEVVTDLAGDAAALVCDRGYLRHQRGWYRRIASSVDRRVVQVEGDVVVPVAEVSDKAEYAARTIRPKILDQVGEYLTSLSPTAPAVSSLPLHVTGDLDPRRPRASLRELDIDRDVGRVDTFEAGTSAARRLLARFLRHDLPGYGDARNDPVESRVSRLSPYLHFGQISPVEVARKVDAAGGPSRADKDAFLEELIVRRELAVNFVLHEKNYDSFRGVPDWARETLEEHADDDRPSRYTAAELEAASTDDPYWNAAMLEMKHRGYLHNHMRMYWGKKILEWSNTPRYAHRVALSLNNRYFLDGRDPSSFANIAWLFGRHDRPWQERPVFGKVRSMTAGGLERKFDVEAWASGVEEQLADG